jgi:hypothetical protein
MQRNKLFDLIDRIDDPMVNSFKGIFQDYVPGDPDGSCSTGFLVGCRSQQ